MPKLMPFVRVSHAELLPPMPPPPEPTDLLRERLLAALGEPPHLWRVQVKPLWGSYYRANVFVGKGVTARMVHSFFVEVGDDGEIASSSPVLQRVY